MDFWSPDFWKNVLAVVPVLVFGGSAYAWYKNEEHRRAWEQNQRKEKLYREVLLAFEGFYLSRRNPEKIQEFVNLVTLCWLYCPDEVIRKLYAFLDTVHTDVVHKDQDAERAWNEVVAALRRDILSIRLLEQTQLDASDFRHRSVTPPSD